MSRQNIPTPVVYIKLLAKLLGGLLIGTLLLSLASCKSGDPAAADKPSYGATPARHAVHTEKLQKLMSELGKTVESDWPQEIAQEKREMNQMDFSEAQNLARKLAEATRNLPLAIEELDITADDREVFMANVDLLSKQAKQLEASAQTRQIEKMRRLLSQVQTTCYGCHSQFRGQPGPLKFGS